MTGQGVQYAGDFNLEEALLISPTGTTTDLLTDVVIIEMNIFEDMFKSSITGSIIVTDTNDIVSKVPIVGQEYLTLKISTPTLFQKKDIIDFTDNPFAVHKISLRRELTSGGQTYELKFVSQEAIKNSQRKISKSYSERKGNVGDIVFDLLSEDKNGVQTSKEVFIEPTTGNRIYVVPNVNPFSAITTLSNEAVSKSQDGNNPSPHYFFFENKDGIHFRSLQSLYEQDMKELFHVGDMGFDEEALEGDPESGKLIQNFRRILAYEIRTRKDLFLNSASGMLGGRLITHDIYKKNYDVKEYNYLDDDDFGQHKRLSDEGDAFRVYNTDRFEDTDFSKAKTHLVPISKTTKDFDAQYTKSDKLDGYSDPSRLQETFLQRQSRLMEIGNGISIQMSVNGRTNLTVGDIIFITVPSIRGSDTENPLYTGRYLIVKLRHTFSKPLRQHEITMEVVRDNSPSDYPSEGNPYEDLNSTTKPTLV